MTNRYDMYNGRVDSTTSVLQSGAGLTPVAEALAAGAALGEVTEVNTGDGHTTFVAVVPAGYTLARTIVDDEAQQPTPRRLVGTTAVWDSRSFVTLWDKHAGLASEVYGDHENGRVTAVINAAGPLADPAWGDHRIRLDLKVSEDWQVWAGRSGTKMGQEEFAGIIETSTPVIVDPEAADMLEIAQTFHATKGVTYESNVNVANGEVQFAYREELQGNAGRSRTLDMPQRLKLRLRVWESAPEVDVTVHLRWRVTDAGLALGWELKRQDEIKRAVFRGLLDELHEALGTSRVPVPVILSASAP